VNRRNRLNSRLPIRRGRAMLTRDRDGGSRIAPRCSAAGTFGRSGNFPRQGRLYASR
jgi:hypothetical protein